MNRVAAAVAVAVVVVIAVAAAVAVASTDSGKLEEAVSTDPDEFSSGVAAIVDGEGEALLCSDVTASGELTISDAAYLCSDVTVGSGATLTIHLEADLVLTGGVALRGDGTVVISSSNGAAIVTGSSGEGYAEVSGGFDTPCVIVKGGVKFSGVEFRDEGFGSGVAVLTASGSSVTFEDCTFSGMDGVAAVESYGDVWFVGCTFVGCSFGSEGLLILNEGAVLTGCTFAGCIGEDGCRLTMVFCYGESEFNECAFEDGDGRGCAIIETWHYVEFNGCTISLEDYVQISSLNYADLAFYDTEVSVESGGSDNGISCSGKVTATGCSFSGLSGVDGGAIYCVTAGVLRECTFTGCSASGSGGAVYVESGQLAMTDCAFESCSAGGAGNAAHSRYDLNAECCTFAGCGAEGEALHSYDGSVVATGCTFAGSE